MKTKKEKLEQFQEKLSNLKFLDPACGSGNFLTETYISLRRIENEIIKEKVNLSRRLTNGQIQLQDENILNPIKLSIEQFYGIEINDFAVTVAKTALWIAESQMLKETEDILLMHIDFLPLKTNAFIHEGNALRMDWNEVVSKNELRYIMGNPPFIGSSIMSQGSTQKIEVQTVFSELEKNLIQDLDYVTCWYKLAAMYIQETSIECCFVSTNSICQGSQVPILWNLLLNIYHIHINFAYQTFRWNSESTGKAVVHCIIVCFSTQNRMIKMLYFSNNSCKRVSNINPYLVEGLDCFITAVKNPLCDVPRMCFGNQPRDGGFLVATTEEYKEILQKEPDIKKWLLPYIGAEEFINGKNRYCFWLKEATLSDIKKSRILYQRVEAVKKFRLDSKAKTTNGYAKSPTLFAQITQPNNVQFLIIPRVSSQKRGYVPMGFMQGDVIASDAVQIIPNATLFHFGVLTSNVHMAWMRTICGRLKSDYRYSKDIVYNNFPWPKLTKKQKKKIEQTAQGILDVRALYPTNTLADLYDELTMPTDLRKAHQNNDHAVMQAYGFEKNNKKGEQHWFTEEECVAELMKIYKKIVSSNNK